LADPVPWPDWEQPASAYPLAGKHANEPGSQNDAKAKNMKERNYLLSGVVGAILGFGCALALVGLARQANSTEGLSRNDVVAFAKSKDEGPLFIWELQRTPEFLYVCNHLNEMIDIADMEKSRTLWLMVWRAAFLTGSREEIAAVFNRYMLSRYAPFTPNYVAHDLSYDPVLADWLLLKPVVGEDALATFLHGVGHQSPDSWGYQNGDYVLPLTVLMRSTERPASIRALAAFTLARWGRATQLGKEARDMLSTLAAKDDTAKTLYETFQVLGAEGGSGSETQTAK